jgi:antitoxin component of MazEF toxin-antitoxin module
MAQVKCAKGTTRKLQRQSNGSVTVALPVELVRALKWRDGQKVVVRKRGETLSIVDWKKK